MTPDPQSDCIRSDQLNDAAIRVSDLPRLFHVSERTIQRWLKADDITTFQHPEKESRPGIPDLAVRWGDLPLDHPKRWRRRSTVG